MKRLLLLCLTVSLITIAYPQRTFKRMTVNNSIAAKRHMIKNQKIAHAVYKNFLERLLKKNPDSKFAHDMMERFNAGKNLRSVINKQMQANYNFKGKQKRISKINSVPAGMGGAVVLNGSGIETLDSQTNTLHGPFLKDYANLSNERSDSDNVFIKVTPNGKTAVSLNFDYGYVQIIDLSNPKNPKLIGNFGWPGYFIECFTISNDGKYLIVGDDDGGEGVYIDVIDLQTLEDVYWIELGDWEDAWAFSNAIAISPDDKTIILSGISNEDETYGYSVFQFNGSNPSIKETQNFTPLNDYSITGISFTPDGSTAIFDGGPVELSYNVTSPGQISFAGDVPGEGGFYIVSSAISPDGKKLYCYDLDKGNIFIFNINGPGDITYSNNFISIDHTFRSFPYSFFYEEFEGYPVQDILAIDGSGSILYANLMNAGLFDKVAQNPKLATKDKTINRFVNGQDVILEADLSNNQVAGVINLASDNPNAMSIATNKNIFLSVAVTSPAGGEDWQTGSGYNITWQSKNVSKVNIELSTDNGTTWSTIATNVSASSGSYNWLITPIPYSTQCRIKISDASSPAVNDESNLFTIRPETSTGTLKGIVLLQPNGGETLQGGTTYYIVFRKLTFFPSVKLEYTTDDGATWNQILPYPLSGLTFYPWTVPLVNSTKCKIRISNWSNPFMNAESLDDFTITSKLSVANYPNPFNPSTVIRFNMLKAGHATIKVYNSIGQQVAMLLDRNIRKGVHEVRFNAGSYPSGVYYYEVNADGTREVKKMMYLK